ncbi:MAG: CopG family transcriptional regulator [Eubacteriales bacterium]|nr:CopG family transcriptional regulator [Eubacteriales bacterium]
MWYKKLTVPKTRLNVWLPEELSKKLDAENQRTGVTKSDLVSLALSEYFARHYEAKADVKGQAKP